MFNMYYAICLFLFIYEIILPVNKRYCGCKKRTHNIFIDCYFIIIFTPV